MLRPLLALLLAVAPLAAAAQMYRWVDDKGQVHYTQTPPPGRAAAPVAPAPPPSEGGNQQSLNQALQADIEKRPERAAEAVRQAQQQARRAERCSAARERLRFLEERTARRLMLTGENGEQTRMTQEQWEQERSAAQQRIADNCS